MSWSKEEEKLLEKLFFMGCSDSDIAKKMSRTTLAIAVRRRKLGFLRANTTRWSHEKVRELLEKDSLSLAVAREKEIERLQKKNRLSRFGHVYITVILEAAGWMQHYGFFVKAGCELVITRKNINFVIDGDLVLSVSLIDFLRDSANILERVEL